MAAVHISILYEMRSLNWTEYLHLEKEFKHKPTIHICTLQNKKKWNFLFNNYKKKKKNSPT